MSVLDDTATRPRAAAQPSLPRSASPLRLDRLLSLLAGGRWGRPAAAQALRIPILMYHSISEQLDSQRHPYYRTVTSPRRFEAQMRLLQREGYRVITLAQALQQLHAPEAGEGSGQGSRSVVITFDDGFRDFLLHAHPVLAELGFPASVYLATAYLDGDFPTGRPCLRRAEVARLAGQGVQFGSHTVSHPRLRELAAHTLRRELRDSRLAIEDLTGQAVTQFACPYGFPEEDTAFVVRLGTWLARTGYSVGVTTCIGRARPSDPALFLPRLPVNELDDDRFLLAKLAGGYDWLRRGQRLAKQVKRQLARVTA